MNKDCKELCMYEEHYFNHKTNKWERINNFSSGGLTSQRVCIDRNCTRRHKFKRSDKVCSLNGKCPNIGINCFFLHDMTLLGEICKYGRNCCDSACSFRHPSGRQTQVCALNENCPDALITCFLLHDLSKIVPLCRYNKECINYMCDKRHSVERISPCPEGSMCYNYIVSTFSGGKRYGGCKLLHPKILQKLCRWDVDSECHTYGCSFIHKPTSHRDCPDGMQCQFRIHEDERLRCTNKHPKFYKVIQIGEKLFFE